MALLTVIGVGNRLRGDDAVGPLVVDKLAALKHPQLELIDAGSDALGVIEYLADREKVLIVDACHMGKQSGSVVHFDPSDVGMVIDQDPQSLHGLGLSEALQMASSLEMLPDDLKIIGIEPDSIQFNSRLSQPVQMALEKIVEEVQNELQGVEGNPEFCTNIFDSHA